MAAGTTTTTSTALKQYWNDMFMENLYDNLAMQGLTKKTTVGTGNGKVVWWVGIGKVNPVGATLSEGADPTARSSRASRVSGTLTEYGNLIKNSRLFMDTAIGGTKEQIIKDLAKDAATTLDDAVLSVALSNATVTFPNGLLHKSGLVLASTATVKDIRNAVRLLQLSSVPRFADGFYVGLIHPDVQYDLQSDSAWTDIVKYRDTVKYDIPGEVGRIWGVRFATAPTIQVLINSGSAKHDVYRTLVFGQDFIGQSDLGGLEVVINEPGRGSELKQYNTYGYRFVSAVACLSARRGICIKTTAQVGS